MATKKIRRFRPGGLVDSEGNPVRDGSGNPIMTGSFPEEDEITARGRAKNAAMFKSFFNRATGRGKSAPVEDSVATPTAKRSAPVAPEGSAPVASEGVIVTPIPVSSVKAKPKPKPKQRVVSKKELEASGLSLRDFLNRERGLTRRGMSKAEAEKRLGLGKPVSKQEVADAKKLLGIGSSPKLDPEATSRNNAPRRKPEPLSSVRRPGTNINYENTDSYDMSMKRGGKVKAYAKGGMTRGDGICAKGKTKGRVT